MLRLFLSLSFAFTTSAVLSAPVVVNHGALELRGEYRPGAEGKHIVVLLHGTLAHHQMEVVRTVQALLEEREIGSLAITLSLGVSGRRGMFPCDTVHRHREESANEELSTWLRWLATQGVEKVTLFGHSRGGNQVARFALQTKDLRIGALVLLAPASSTPGQQARSYQRRHRSPLAEILARADAAPPDAVLADVGFLHCDRAKVTRESFASYYRPDPRRDTLTLLTELQLPALVVTGSEDNVVPNLPDQLEAKFAAGTGAQADQRVSHIEVEGADHFFRDLYAEDVADAIETFLGSH